MTLPSHVRCSQISTGFTDLNSICARSVVSRPRVFGLNIMGYTVSFSLERLIRRSHIMKIANEHRQVGSRFSHMAESIRLRTMPRLCVSRARRLLSSDWISFYFNIVYLSTRKISLEGFTFDMTWLVSNAILSS